MARNVSDGAMFFIEAISKRSRSSDICFAGFLKIFACETVTFFESPRLNFEHVLTL